MNILLSESQLRVIISEDKKNRAFDILTNKIGLSERFANDLIKICGNLSVFIFNKVFTEAIKHNPQYTREGLIKFYSEHPAHFYAVVKNNRSGFVSIMDWIRVGLNGNLNQYRDLPIEELYEKSKEWHDSLGVGASKFDFQENTDNIILDFRDEQGYGYYWVDLKTNRCSDEQERMGHCASSRGSLYSFREFKSVPGGKHTLNKSLLTASISDQGSLLQLKGPKNSKPDSKYTPYILPLFRYKSGNNYLINSIGSEYDSKNDFKLIDLPDDNFVELYKERPELFKERAVKKKLAELGLIERKILGKHILKIGPDDVRNYLKGGWKVGKNSDVFEVILSGNMWELWQSELFDGDWESALKYYVNDENKNKIIEMVKSKAGQEYDENMDLESLIDDWSDEIKNAIRQAVSDSEENAHYEYLYKQLRKALSEYGNVIKMNDEGVQIEIDLDNLLSDLDDDVLDEYEENCGDNVLCLFQEAVHYETIDIPTFYVDERYSPSIDEKVFNETLSYHLDEI